MTYNIWWPRNRDAVAEVVKAVAPDVLLVQESPKAVVVWRWYCDRLAAGWGLHRAAGGRDAGSNMICVSARVEVLATTTRRLRQPRFAPRRGIVTAQCRVDGVELGMVSAHLSLLAGSREGEAHQVLRDAARLRGPVLVGGDLNERPAGPAWRVLTAAGYVDAARPGDMTYSSTTREKRIDGLLVKGVEVSGAGVPDLPAGLLAAASDHCPVVATLEVG